MNKCCFEKGCYESPIWSCNCINPPLYVCDRHINRHMRSLGKHETECTIVELTHRQTIKLLPRLNDLLKHLKGNRKSIKNNSKILIECIQKETKKALININILQKAVVDLICGRSIFKEIYERIKPIKIESQDHIRNDAEKIKESIKILFEFYYNEDITWKECSEIIFSRDSYEGLFSIDLNTFKLSSLKYTPKIGKNCHACKIDQNTYFFHGGSTCNIIKSEAYLINTKDQKYEKLADGPGKCYGGGSALKNNKVYIFGGNIERSTPTNTCDIFDLKRKEWKSITPLPQASDEITAALLNNDIILSGFHLNCCYSYNGSTFTSILDLTIGSKVICEGWIFANSILYENRDQMNTKWISHNVNYRWDKYLWTYCVFKKNQYLYFIDARNSLIRINTKMKMIETILFT